MSNAGGGFLGNQLSQQTAFLGLRLWQIIALAVGAFTVLILFLLSLRLSVLSRRKSKNQKQLIPVSYTSNAIPEVSKEIKEVESHWNAEGALQEKHQLPEYELAMPERVLLSSTGDILDDEKQVVTFAYGEGADEETPNFHSVRYQVRAYDLAETKEARELGPDSPRTVKENPLGGEEAGRQEIRGTAGSAHGTINADDDTAVPIRKQRRRTSGGGHGRNIYAEDHAEGNNDEQFWAAGWGHWYSVEQLEKATGQFAEKNIIGKGGYGVVYRGQLPDASLIAVKHLLNSRELQAEREFRLEVATIGRVRHKNLVGLLGYCAERSYRMLVYEYVDNGNLEQWLHGPLGAHAPLSWDARMKIVLGTAKGLAYLHEDLEPAVVHRDVKSSNILLDRGLTAKVSDFGLAKLLGTGMTHVTTRVMGTFGYIAPEYVNTGMLTESSDVYSFGVLMMEVITGRKPVDYTRPAGEVNLVDWMKRMVGSKQWDDVADPRLEPRPSGRDMKRALLVALRCVDPDAHHRPRMGHVVYMLDADDAAFRNACKRNSQGRPDGPK